MSVVIEVSGLTKQYGGIKAVDALSFQVMKGQVFAFLGQNGAGKSTTIRMLLSLIRPDAGIIRLFGKDLNTERIAVLHRIGAVIEKPDLYGYLSGYENLSLFAKLNGLSSGSAVLQEHLGRVGLSGRSRDKVKTYSQGMKQRLGIAVALVHNPDLVILDEPTNGLDPQGIVDMRNLILSLSREQGKTVFISSHMLSEVEQIADHMLIIEKGRKIMQGPVSELISPDFVTVKLDTSDNQKCVHWLMSTGWDEHAVIGNDGMIQTKISAGDRELLSSALLDNGYRIREFTPMNSLEDYFLSITQ